MKSLVKINFFVALLLATVSSAVYGHLIAKILNDMANEGKSIDRIFKPMKEGLLGKGAYSVAYRGILLLNGMEVAMKFTIHNSHAKHEYKIYTYLNAINNPNVEALGVPSIYFYGEWNNYYMMAMTLLDSTFNERFRNNKYNKIDLLITIREFVRITKYIHSRGVFQRDVKSDHMMYRKHLGFLFDFNLAKDCTNCNRELKLSAAKNDWRSFLNVMRKYTASHADWLGFNLDDVWRMQYDNFIPGLLEDSKIPEKFDGLRKVFIVFARYAYGGNDILEIPFYDLLYQTIVEEIEKWEIEQRMPAIPSWLSTEDINAAIMAKDAIPSSISDIRNPFGLDEVEYEHVNYEFFSEFYHDKLNAEKPELERESKMTAEEPELEKKSKKSIFKFWK